MRNALTKVENLIKRLISIKTIFYLAAIIKEVTIHRSFGLKHYFFFKPGGQEFSANSPNQKYLGEQHGVN